MLRVSKLFTVAIITNCRYFTLRYAMGTINSTTMILMHAYDHSVTYYYLVGPYIVVNAPVDNLTHEVIAGGRRAHAGNRM